MSTDEHQDIMSNQTRELFATINETCVPGIDRYSVPIFGVQDNEIRHDRTGILYRIADEHFVLTAAHKLYQIVKANIPLYLSMNKPGILPLYLGKAKCYSTEDEGRDVAAIWISPETACEVAKHKEFLSHNQIDLNGAESGGLFLFFGYPMTWSGHVVSKDYVASQGLAFITLPYDGTRLESAYYNQNIHMVLDFKRDAINCLQGSVDTLPKLHGISGCGVWQVGDITNKEIKFRNEKSLTLVGIQHRWFPDLNYIQATKIRFAIDFIAENYPDVQTAMKIVYPKR